MYVYNFFPFFEEKNHVKRMRTYQLLCEIGLKKKKKILKTGGTLCNNIPVLLATKYTKII